MTGASPTMLLKALLTGLLALGAMEVAAMPEDVERLIAEIEADVAMTAGQLGFDRLEPAVIQALREIPREVFVPPTERHLAYRNHPLPIGQGQTISQPYIVAIMSQLLGVGPGDRVFELGTGSGYQAAILAAMGVEVYSVEIVPELAERAAATLATLGLDRVRVKAGDGWLGWPEAAPFDAIVLTAAATEIPRPLVEQLKPGGRLLMPLGDPQRVQQLVLFVRGPQGDLIQREILAVRFVPVTRPPRPDAAPDSAEPRP